MARDAAIIVGGIPSLGDGWLFPFADVALIDADTEQAVPLAEARWFALRGSDVVMALHPVDALAPLHAYRAEARLRVGLGSSTESAAAPVVSGFTTSDVLLDPLALNGEIGFSLRGAEVDVLDDNTCGPGRVIGQRPALFADVQLPAPSGAQGVFVAVLYFSDDAPLRINPYDSTDYDRAELEAHQVYDMQVVNIQAGQALTLEQEVLGRDFAYAGCFTLVVTDPSGQAAQASRCLPSLTPGDVRALSNLEAPLPVSTDEMAANEEIQRAAAEHREAGAPEFGCALDPSATTRTPAWCLLLLGALAAARASRRPPDP